MADFIPVLFLYYFVHAHTDIGFMKSLDVSGQGRYYCFSRGLQFPEMLP